MNILALDPAANTGWAHSNGQFGLWLLRLQGAPIGDQHVRLEQYLERAIATMGCDVIATENAGFGAFNPQTKAQHNERLGIIRLVAARHGIDVHAFQPKAIKLFATGDGEASKAEMVAACRRLLGITVTSDDEADAIWICEFMKRPDCWPKRSPKKKKRGKGKGERATKSSKRSVKKEKEKELF